jgi:agmatinase
MHNGSANLASEMGVDLNENPRFVDLGDRDIGPGPDALMKIESHIAAILDSGALPLSLGGDHAITYPIMRAIHAKHGPVGILHFDAHPDLYHEYDGNPLSHACPFARIMENELASRLVQVGIRALNGHQREQAERFGVEIHEMKDFDPSSFTPDFSGPVYLTIDMDALDPAYAPGVSHHEPGGLSVRTLIDIIHRLKGTVIGADIVCYNPRRDINDMTAMVAVKLLKEVGGRMLSDNG